ncbi:hypothetical protein [Bradyrhizobium retamae]|uniref:Uncharacterized protein n=1 Tax=Bradyrhizobium retamae TaxID=1300035 RepID=A0A0R3NDW4_9BRAD|nr:hypothetical protein [Bradyrhizobium retamae]KRR30489.1 hypothetical protein CQ13_02330 [Bradyrhizobium retamae]
MIATWCFIFIGVMRELSAAIVLFTSQTKVLSVLIYDLNESGDLAAISVLGIAMLGCSGDTQRATHAECDHLCGGARGEPNPDVWRRCGGEVKEQLAT